MHCKKLVSKLLSSLTVVCVAFVLTMFSTGTTYALNHSGAITSSETWALADSPHIVTANVNVYNGAILTIEPGSLVKFDPGAIIYFGISGVSTLNAVGTSGNPITFTSNAGTPAAGDWQGIIFGGSTDDGSTIMDYCTVEYGGNGGNNANIYCQTSSPTIQNCTIRHSDGYGIYCDNNSAPTLTNNTISDNGIFPISEFCNQLDSNVTGNTGSGNGTDAIEVRGGAMTSSHTWVVQDFYFKVSGSNINVYNGATLTIPPGSLVKFDPGAIIYFGISGASTLNAVGTSLNPITFTSNESSPAAGDWQGIIFGGSTSGSTTMHYCTVEYGGDGSYNANIYCQSTSAPTIQNCTIRHSDGYGIYCDNNSAPTLTNNTISDNGLFPISEFCNQLDSNVTGNTGSGNGTDAIEVRGGAMTSSHTWVVQDFYFKVSGSNINVYSGATLTIPPGSLVKFDPGAIIYFGISGVSTLNAVGTSGNPITFTSNETSPAAGDWKGIMFGGSTSGATIMDYCTVEYGGDGNANIYCQSTSAPTIQNCTIRHSDGYGIYCDNNAAPTLTNNTISNNGSFPISEYANQLDSNVTGNTGSGNGTDAIEVRGGAMTSSHTWIPQDLYFNITSTINVYNGAIWTISPGCLVKLHGDIILWIGISGVATLIAEGTSGDPITFTSNASSPAAGDWDGIYFGGSTTGSTTMHYCTVEYGGDFNISCASASPTIQHCIIRNSGGDLAGVGINTTGSAAQPLISCSTITNNKTGVYATSNANPTIVDCSITGNTSYGVFNTTSAITIDAENNWWGNASGPSGVGPGTGDAVSDYVDYTPFRTAFDSCLETIVLSPVSDTNLVGSQHTVTAEVNDESDNAVEGIVVSFEITAGPHAGQNGTDTTDAGGEATFTYTGTLEGTDTIEASFVDFHGRTRTSNAVTKGLS